MNHLYLHGFASSPGSTKAVAIREALAKRGHEVEVPDLNVPSFSHLTITAMFSEAEQNLRAPSIVWGSSLGGYLACMLAHRFPERVAKLVLMAPAVDFPESYPARAHDADAAWARNGTVPVFHHGAKQVLPLGRELRDDCASWAVRPPVMCPTLVFAARRDDVVPLETIERWTRAQLRAELVILDDVHDLNASTPAIVERALKFVG